MECCICFETTTNWVIPCQHAMCVTCALEWFDQKAITCPMCRGVVISPTPHPIPLNPVLKITCMDNARLEMCVVDHAKGVQIHHVAKGGAAYTCGLRKGDIVTHMNSIPIKDHEQAVTLMDAVNERKYPLLCTIEPRTKAFHRMRLAIRRISGVYRPPVSVI